MPNTDTEEKDFQLQLEARGRAQEGAVEAWREQQQQRLQELRMFKEVGESELSALHEETALMKEKIRLRDSINMQQQHKSAFAALDKIDPNKDLDPQITAIEFDNPLVSKDPAFRQAVAHRYEEAEAKSRAANENLVQAADISKKYGVPLAKKQGSDLYDIEAMTTAGLAVSKTPADAPAGFHESERTVSPSGELTQQFKPNTEEVPSEIRDQYAITVANIAENEAKFKLASNQDQKDPLISEWKGLKAKAGALETLYPQLKPAAPPPPPPPPAGAPAAQKTISGTSTPAANPTVDQWLKQQTGQ